MNMASDSQYSSLRAKQQEQQMLKKVVQESEQEKEAPKKKEEKPVSRSEVQNVINSLVNSIEKMAIKFKQSFITKNDIRDIKDKILMDMEEQGYVTLEEIKQIAKDAVPPSLRGLDSDPTRKLGDTLKLLSGQPGISDDKAIWDVAVGFLPKGDKVLYKGIFLREYDEDGTIVAAGSEINPADYATQALYETALTDAEHTLKATWDWMRSGLDITP